MISQPSTREAAIRAVEKHILDVSQGRLRLGLKPHEVDRYIQDEYQRLEKLRSLRFMA